MKDGLNKVEIKYSKTEESSRNGEGGIYKTQTQGFPADRAHLGGCWSRGRCPCTLSQSPRTYSYASDGLCSFPVVKELARGPAPNAHPKSARACAGIVSPVVFWILVFFPTLAFKGSFLGHEGISWGKNSVRGRTSLVAYS